MLKNYFLPALLLLFFKTASGQEAPAASIGQLLDRAKNFNLSKPDSAQNLLRRAEQIAQTAADPLLIFKVWRATGIFHEDQNQLAEAKIFYKKALELARERLPEAEQFKIMTDWAILHKKTGDYRTAFETHSEVIERARAAGNWALVEDNFHGLGTIFSFAGDFDKAIEAYLQSIAAAEKHGNRGGIVISKQNMSNTYRKAKNFEMAQRTVEETLKMAIELGDSARVAAVLRVFGDIRLDMGDLDGACEKLRAAQQIFEKRNNRKLLAETLLSRGKIEVLKKNYAAARVLFDSCHLFEQWFSAYQKVAFYHESGNLHSLQGQSERAAADFETSLSSIGSFGFRDLALKNHLALADLQAAAGRFDWAFRHCQAAKKLNEEIFEESRQRSLAEAQLKYDSEKRELQLQAKAAELDRSEQQKRWLWAGIAAVLGLLIFTFFQMRARQKAQARAELLNKELHHRVKNNLQTITSILRLQSRELTDPAAAEALDDSRRRLETIGLIHQQIFQNEELRLIDFRRFSEELFEKIQFLHFDKLPTVEFSLDISPVQIEVDRALPLALILNELMTNSFKHAFADTPQPRIELSVSAEKFFYFDNGCGFPSDIATRQPAGFGVQMIRSLVAPFCREFRFFNEQGGCFLAVFK